MVKSYVSGPDADWQERVRAVLYPKLHPVLARFGGYATGTVAPEQFVCSTEVNEGTIEDELHDTGFVRNPIACYKSLPDGTGSEGSWVLFAENDPEEILEEGRQLHITLFPRKDSTSGRRIYAHEEYDWRSHPVKHLRETDFGPRIGADKARLLINEHTFLTE